MGDSKKCAAGPRARKPANRKAARPRGGRAGHGMTPWASGLMPPRAPRLLAPRSGAPQYMPNPCSSWSPPLVRLTPPYNVLVTLPIPTPPTSFFSILQYSILPPCLQKALPTVNYIKQNDQRSRRSQGVSLLLASLQRHRAHTSARSARARLSPPALSTTPLLDCSPLPTPLHPAPPRSSLPC